MSTLLVLAGPDYPDSVSRPLAISLAGQSPVVRDLFCGVQTVTEGNFPQIGNPYLEEVLDADRIVIASPVHNFNISAALKAWIDQIVVAGASFTYTARGPAPLLSHGKEVIVVSASGGTPVGSKTDFFSDYLTFIFKFIGIDDVTFINAGSRSG